MPLSKRNRRGVLWLLIVGAIIVISPRIISTAFGKGTPLVSYNELIETHTEIVEKKKHAFKRSKKESRFSIPPSKFDPNNYTVADWMNVGLSKRQAEVVLKFTKRGIRSKEDLKKIFVFPDQLFQLVKDSIEIKFEPQFETEKRESVTRETTPVDINKASQDELETIPGVGPYFAKKMVERRNELGGYIGKHQLLEIWKFDAEKLDQIDAFITISSIETNKFNINQATVDELKGHPYISYSVANAIVKYREQHGGYLRIEDCKNIKIIDEELFEKVQPYLEVK